MRHARIRMGIVMLVALSLGSCLAVDPEPGLEHVRDLSATRTDAEILWVRSDEDSGMVRERIESMLVGGLTRDEAVRIAVLDNPQLQVRLADIGIAAADVVQASLPTNPTLDFYWASPNRTGDSAVGLVGWISDLWTLPRRKAVAETAAQRTHHDVALAVVMTAERAAHAWDRLVAAREELAIAHALLEVRRSEMGRREIRLAHGLDGVRLVALAGLRTSEQQVVVEEFAQELTMARTEFDRLLGMRGGADAVPGESRIDGYLATSMTLDEVVATGLSERLDVAMAELEVEGTSRRLGLEEALVWDAVAVGVGKDGRFSQLRNDEDSVGLTITVDLPIFDQNQAGMARAQFQIEQAVSRLAAVRQRAVKDLIDGFHALERARANLVSLEGSALPSAQRAHDYMQHWNQRMQVSAVDMFETEGVLLETQIATSRARLAENDAWRHLQLVTRGGREAGARAN